MVTEPQFLEPDFTLPPIPMDRADGYQMGDVTIQGVRAYDPSTAQWVSPDAYAGTTTDPGSQKPFMWNGNNPAAYADPTGLYTQPMFEDSSNVGLENEEGDVGAIGSISSDIANVSALSGIGGDAENGTYKSENDAAMAVALRYTKTAYSSGKEAGALIYCTNGGRACGYGPLIPGHKLSVSLTNVDFESLPKNATVVGFWHAHPDGDTVEDLSGHMEEAWRIVNSHFASAPFTIYTSLGRDLVSQVLNSEINPIDNSTNESIDPNYICRGCLP